MAPPTAAWLPYRFMVWAGGGLPGPCRIRDWWEGAGAAKRDVCDNGFNQATGGGNLVVHTG